MPRFDAPSGSSSHRTAFGAEPEGEGVRFRLWAPAASRTEVVVERDRDDDATYAIAAFPMEREEGGWFHLWVPDLPPGALYRYRIDGGDRFPDPASRFQPRGVHGPSQVVDPAAYHWLHPEWEGRPWSEAIFYELHVGTFTSAGTFEGVRERLDHLVELGVTVLELMPVAAFPGGRGWGYDGVFPFAPDRTYGSPDALKRLVDEAHGRGLMVFLDVVYNHFGPEGNHLHRYAPGFFTDRFDTPWGDAIDFSRRPVREFFIQNALCWLEEYRFDGLRLDAVHAICDEGSTHILDELADAVHARFDGGRRVHLVLENGRNEARYLARRKDGEPFRYAAQWNDDLHHAMHVLITGEREGYYAPYAEDPLRHLGRCLAEGFAFQGEPFSHWDGHRRGEASRHLPPTAFVNFLQNHDQVGNRALGERISGLAESRAVEALLSILLLAPSPPLLFMGEEWAAPEPFLFFCDFGEELAETVREGRRKEFARFPAFRGPAARERIPDPNALETFLRSVLDWDRREEEPHARRLQLVRDLLAVRRREIVPRLEGAQGGSARWTRFGETGLEVSWPLAGGVELILLANLGDRGVRRPRPERGRRWIHGTHGISFEGAAGDGLPPWSAIWFLS
jgi:maltooligosyltrehalose trehalohydrolase